MNRYATTFEAAADYIGRGWPLLPVMAREKRPATRHGKDDASLDQAVTENWFGQGQDLNVGVSTGPTSGVVVYDCDFRSGGEASFEKLERDIGPLPKTVKALTSGGGFHLYFSRPEGLVVGDIVGLQGYPGSDIKDGGYVVAPPSIQPPSPHPDCRGPPQSRRQVVDAAAALG